jgi:hypothetical protein
VGTRALGLLTLILLSACAATQRPPSDPILVVDSNRGCEGAGPHLEYRWEREGDWFVRGDEKVPAGLVTRLREVALSALAVETAPLPPELRFTDETVLYHSSDIWEAARKWRPWLADWVEPDIDRAQVAKVARERLIDPATDTNWSTLSITLPGTPPVTITTESQVPYAQPWLVAVGEAPPRKVLSVRLSRYVMLLVDPSGPNYRHLEGAGYWANGFWQDDDLWSRIFGNDWNRQYARELCTEIEGWSDIEKDWRLESADIGDINRQPLSLQPDLTAKHDSLIESVRWWNRIDDGEPRFEWSSFLEVHGRATEAAARLPFLTRWKEAGKNRVISLDAVGRVGHTETQASFFHAPVWTHSKLQGEPSFELLLRIDGDHVATVLLGDESDGAIVLTGHETLRGTAGIRFHPTVGDYAIVRPDGGVEQRRMPPVKPR